MEQQFSGQPDVVFASSCSRLLSHAAEFSLIPISALMLVLGGLLVLTKGSALAPFVCRAVSEELTLRILGISAYYHDSAATLVCDGIVAAAQEERFTRRKHDAGFPDMRSNTASARAGSVCAMSTEVVFYEKPFLKFERLLETYVAFAPRGYRSFSTAMPLWFREKLFLKDLLRQALHSIDSSFDCKERLLFTEHHESHAASAFYPSPFRDAAVLTMDGVGEWTTTSLGIGEDHRLEIFKEIHFPHSLGLLYSAFTSYLGFKVNSGEYKVMGLAPYGAPRHAQLILDRLIDLKDDGSFRLNLDYLDTAPACA